MIDLLEETDCDKLAASIRSFVDANQAQIDAIAAWPKAHAVDKDALVKAMAPTMKNFQNHMAVFQNCKRNKAFAAALDAASANFPR